MALLVTCPGGSVLTVDMAGVVIFLENSYFGLQAMLVGSLGVSGPCTLQIYFGL